jgi:hypothetical protein
MDIDNNFPPSGLVCAWADGFSHLQPRSFSTLRLHLVAHLHGRPVQFAGLCVRGIYGTPRPQRSS